MAGEKNQRDNVFKLLKENKDLREEIDQLKKRIPEMESSGKIMRHRGPDYFHTRAEEEVARASRYKFEFAVLLGELDNLDIYTKRHGREATEEILGMLEIVIQDSLCNTDLKCDFGVGKFGVQLPYTDCIGAQMAAEKIRQAVERVFALKSQTANIRLTVSIGLACYPRDAECVEDLMVKGREAFVCARTQGNSVCIAAEKGQSVNAEAVPGIQLVQNDSFLRAMDDEISRCSRYGLKFTLVALAVTDLEINKTGMDGATRAKIMRAVFQKLAGTLRAVDKCYLYTDSRFALVLPGTGVDGGSMLAQKLVQVITTAPVLRNETTDTFVSINMGMAAFPSDDVARDGLLRKVETALKHATGKGNNQYSLASDALSCQGQGQGQRDINEWVAMLKDGGQGAIFNLLSVVDMTERYEPAHSQAVARYALVIGRAMGLTTVALRRLRIMAMLHDLGKICISPAIFSKPGPLREDEREVMVNHPQYGSAILEQLPDFTYCYSPVLSHHEMWDGRGYPHGIKGDKIPVESRIIAVAEAFDDMISPRPYRSLVLLDDAVRELREKAGTQFDLAIVEAFIKTLPGLR